MRDHKNVFKLVEQMGPSGAFASKIIIERNMVKL